MRLPWPAGEFKIAIPGPFENANKTGDFDIHDSVAISGAGRNLTFIDGQQLDRVFHIDGAGSIQVALAGMTVRNGKVSGPGGGIAVEDANLIVRDAAVTGNQAAGDDGGGIWGGAGVQQTTLIRSTVARNVATDGGNGGGVLTSGSLAVQGSVVQRNIATGKGGGISAGPTTLTNCTVRDNTAGDSGGGMSAGTANLTKSAVSGNSAGNSGGGISATTANLTSSTVSGNTGESFGGGISAGTATLTSCTMSGNTAAGGGGIFAFTVNLTNSTVSGNDAGQLGGGIRAESGTLTNCTIAENLANHGGGLFNDTLFSSSPFNLRNTIVALNLVRPGNNGAPDVAGGEFTSLGHNLIGDGTGGTGFTNGDLVGTSLNPIDPRLGPLADNGGPNKTHALLRGSPAIDFGSADALAALTAAVDARAATLPVSNTAAFVPGMRLRLGGEVVVVVAVDAGKKSLTVRRGVSGTGTAHAAGTGLFLAADQRGLARRKDGNGDGKSIIDVGAFER